MIVCWGMYGVSIALGVRFKMVYSSKFREASLYRRESPQLGQAWDLQHIKTHLLIPKIPAG